MNKSGNGCQCCQRRVALPYPHCAAYLLRDNDAPEVVEPEVVELQKKKPVVAGVTVRTTWTFSVDDPDAVPREFCKPDEVLIRQYMQNAKANGAKLETLRIPGVTFTEKVSV